MQRFGLRDDQWERIKDLLPGREGHVGGNAAAYDADPFVETLTQRGITPVMPPKANRNIKRECDFALYCERNLVERFFNLLKHSRHRHTLRQACEKFPRRGTVGCRYNPPQLNTGPRYEQPNAGETPIRGGHQLRRDPERASS